MTRLESLKDRVQQYPYKKSALKLTEAEFDEMVAFIEENDELGHLEFEYAVNRMFLSKKEKPKHAFIMMELLVVCNFAVHGRRRTYEDPK
jgi:hypothetical protein